MDHTDSTHSNPQPTRPSLRIDLNEAPTSSSSVSPTLDALSIVRSYHEHLSPAAGAPATLPAAVTKCAACRSPIIEGRFLVCDGCELGFHIDCAEMQGHELMVNEWLCGDCVSKAVPCNGWPLGLRTKAKGNKRGRSQLLDMNALPCSDGEGEDLQFPRKHNPGDNTSGGNPFGVPVPYSRLLHFGNGFRLQAASVPMRRYVKLGSVELIPPRDSRIHSLAEFDVCPSSERVRSPANIRSPHMRNKMYLESLREFICRSCGGVLQEGWSVEFKNSKSKDEMDVLYCAPDGKKFGSMSEVACYLGLTPNADIVECEKKSYEFDSSARGSLQPKRRKTARLAPTNGVAESQENVMGDFYEDQLSGINVDIVGESVNCTKVTDAISEETSGSASREYNDGFPVQFEDFFIFSAGKINHRPSYHNANEIWPIGYKSCWHDKITGSLFICDVLDGGDSGPVFKIKRSPCSLLPIPVGSTVLFKSNLGQLAGQHQGNSFCTTCTDEDYSVLMMLSEPSPPENDILSCLGNTSICSNDQTSKGWLFGATCDGKSRNVLSDNTMLQDEIGEFSVEERSSSLAWRMVSEKLFDACQKVFTQTGIFKYFCKHAAEATGSSEWVIKNQKLDQNVDPLAKLCGLFESTDIPSIILDHKDFEVSSELLLKWIDQDRFGLNLEFVQELLEQNLGAITCHEYVYLKDRKTYSSSLTIGNGFLLAKKREGVDLRNEKSIDGSIENCQTSNKPEVKDKDNISIPPGKPVSSRLPPQLLSDALQVREFLFRFHDVLELRDPISFEEIEEELISPWFDCSHHEKFQGGSSKCIDFSSHRTVITESGPAVSDKDPHALLHGEIVEMKEESQAKLASIAFDRCNGFALTKIHSSLIRVLIGELQAKVTVTIDPKFDVSELKSKRKKDTDSWISAIRTKVKILPLNELTWPELVRRYILSLSLVGGRFDYADITTRECRSVFRCVQGDGGVLCGSPTGVAGKEADAAFLAEATHNIFGSLIREHDMIAMDDVKSQENIHERVGVEDGDLPEWAKALEPVRKLPTNVGARIRRCIFEALDKSPPEWAKKVLEHSISKGVYKGNASGPTKKAVLSVLADLQIAGLQQKPGKEQKKKRYVSISDIVMKRCRNVLRHVASHDDAKKFCNLLGRKFMDFSGGDDEGHLGSPATVPRPLDFRTIDLKLAAGAYGGSHEAFLEDVREFWANIHIAYKDQPDLIKLVEMMSQNFDSLYGKEVLTQFQKLVECRQSECLSAESQNEIELLLRSTGEIPKAPWEEGVCKICGIDRDDNNVLLCDKCDAEYHKYCLNPPLAKIPEGNWYCPSCVAGKCITQVAPDTRSNFLHCLKYQGEFTRAHLDFLAHLASDMEEREYWELGVYQRSYLLKFLCDEMLRSALVRQHIDKCIEASTELMQNLRSTSAELKTLKYKEESLEAKAAKSDRSFRLLGTDTEQGSEKYFTRQYSSKSKSDCFNKFSGDLFHPNRDQTNAACDTPDLASSEDLQRLSASLATVSISVDAGDPSMFHTNSQSHSPELTSIRTQILRLNDSFAGIESQFLKVSVRREFLGRDSSGRLYWVLADLGTQSSPIYIGNVEMQRSGQIISASFSEDVSNVSTDAAGSKDALKTFGKSRTLPLCPYELGDNKVCPTWVSYKSDAEIKKLLDHLQDNNPSERDLKESILQWQKLRTQGNRESESQHPEGPQMTLSSGDDQNIISSNSLSTVATSLLVDKYGPCVAPESSEHSNRRFKNAKGMVQQKMYRCECLEPIWPSRHHCISCHRTFLNDVELDGHNDGKCSKVLPTSVKWECHEIPKGKGMMKTELGQGGYMDEMSSDSASKSGLSRLTSSSLRHKNDKSFCPFDYEDICSKFVLNESNKELVKGIGLLGSNGIPMFVPSISPHLSDSTAMLLPLQEAVVVEADKLSNVEQLTFLQDSSKFSAHRNDSFPSNSLQSAVEHQDRKISLHCCAPLCKEWNCCVVPEPALRPVIGKAGYVLQQLKINLLDMDAALPDEAIRPSKRKLERRWAWRSFVKSAERIYEMAQATIALEDMIKSEYLSNTWWYWSSLITAAKISTLSSLALRIYSLDAAIYYNKTSCSNTLQKRILSKKRKEQEI